jgi:hypothetical protein
MNKLLVGSFCSLALSLAGNFSPAPELVDRARAHAQKGFKYSNIRYEDGIDAAEAFALAEQEILGDIISKRLPVQRYDRPKKAGDFWRINVFIKTSKGLKNRPMLVDSITGDSHGDGVYDEDSWVNTSIHEVNLGSSHYRIKRGRFAYSFHVEVTLNRMTERNDLTARQECSRDVIRAIAKIKENFPGQFEDVLLRDIMISESELSNIMYSIRNRQWFATFLLIQKGSVRP